MAVQHKACGARRPPPQRSLRAAQESGGRSEASGASGQGGSVREARTPSGRLLTHLRERGFRKGKDGGKTGIS